MIIALAYPNAARYYRQNKYYQIIRDKLNSPEKNRQTLPVKYGFKMDEVLLKILLENHDMELPLHLIVPDGSYRIRSKDVVCTVRPTVIPDESFVEYYRGKIPATKEVLNISVASPELCYLQAASQLSQFELIRFGYELCADFYYDDNERYGLAYHSPASNRSKLEVFLNRSNGMTGKRKAQQVLPYIHDHARSPMEILQSMIVNLPISYGGFAMKGFELNGNADLSAEGKQILGFDTCRCDIVWKKHKVVLEYDSDQVHLDSIQHAKDKNRATALSVSGYKVFTLTTSDLHKIEKVEAVMFALRNALGMKKETKQFQKFRKKRVELLDWVRGQMQSPDEKC